jgi:DNA segregation ATPase FtsK/SpoIIIE-like protein
MKKYVSLAMRATYSPRDDSVHLTTDDPRLAKRGWRLTLNRGSATELSLRALLQAEGLIKPKVSLPKTIAYPQQDDHPWYEFPLGLNTDGDEAVLDVRMDPHTLIAGRAGGGKTVVQRSIITHALTGAIPWQIVGIDLKRVILSEYPALPFIGSRFKHVKDLEAAAVAIAEVEQEMMRRYEQLEAAGRFNMETFIDRGYASPILLLIDEVYPLLAMDDMDTHDAKARNLLRSQIMTHLGSIMRLGRAAAVHVVASTQRPQVDVIPSEMRNNMENRIQLGRTNPTLSSIMLDNQLGTQIPEITGRGIMFHRGSYSEVQFYYLQPGGVEERMIF